VIEWQLAICLVAGCVTLLDISIFNVALPSMERGLYLILGKPEIPIDTLALSSCSMWRDPFGRPTCHRSCPLALEIGSSQDP
jgi:hypothetical protein